MSTAPSWRAYSGLGSSELDEGCVPLRPSTPNSDKLHISRPDHTIRSAFTWEGGAAEIVQTTGSHRVDLRFFSELHLLILHDRGARRDGESCVEGLPTSTLKDFARRLTFVPAGHRYHEWMEPRSPVRMVCFYFDPLSVASKHDNGAVLHPRLFFEDVALLESMRKLQASLEVPALRNAGYIAALAMMLTQELPLAGRRKGTSEIHQGGLAPWQQRVVVAHIEGNLSETIRLATLARLARLSTFHFCRAFKQTFGVPPHRYHTDRRIEHAKDLLAERRQTVTDIGLTLGYSETSSFSAAFRKTTGITPSAYRRNLG